MVAHVIRRTVMVVQMDVERLVLLLEALLLLFLLADRGRVVGDVDGTRDGPNVLHVLLSVAVQSAVNALRGGEIRGGLRVCCYVPIMTMQGT